MTGPLPELLPASRWPAVEALFESVFGHPLPRALTAWKYAPGRGLSIGLADPYAADGGVLIAHCGLMFRDILAFGQPRQAAQLVDLMVAPRVRGQLLRQGSPFAKVVGHALAQLGSALNPRNPERVAFGFPSARAMRLAEHLELVREIDQVHEVTWPPLPGPVPAEVDAADAALPAMVDQLWVSMRQQLSQALVGVRDGEYFISRYLHHPTRRYQVHLLQSAAAEPLAVFALRREADRFELADWVCPLDAVPAMLRAAQAATAAASCTSLSTWITSGFVDSLAVGASRQRVTEFRIICRADLPADQWQRQHRRWWLTPGDTDYR